MKQQTMDVERFFLPLMSKSTEETLGIGTAIGRHLEAGDVVALIGELGSGKTCLTRGIARGLDVPEVYRITSPTFTLINEYPGRLMLYHLDIYRLGGVSDLEDMGYEEYFYGNGAVVIEWAEKIRDILPAGSYFVDLLYVDESRRKIRIACESGKVEKIFKAIKEGGFS